jgi:hypothetical protein
MAAKDLRQFFFDIHDAEAHRIPGLKLDQHVDIAVRSEIIAQDRTIQGELADVMPPAEVGQSLMVDGDLRTHARLPLSR